MSFSPILSWQGNWVQDITSRINLNYSESKTIQFQDQGNIINNSTNQSATADLSWSFSAEKGLKIPLPMNPTTKKYHVAVDRIPDLLADAAH